MRWIIGRPVKVELLLVTPSQLIWEVNGQSHVWPLYPHRKNPPPFGVRLLGDWVGPKSGVNILKKKKIYGRDVIRTTIFWLTSTLLVGIHPVSSLNDKEWWKGTCAERSGHGVIFKVVSWYCLDWLKNTKETSFRAVVCITAWASFLVLNWTSFRLLTL
jgi:hypothetical protein